MEYTYGNHAPVVDDRFSLPRRHNVGSLSFSRSRSSKIQDNVIRVVSGKTVLSWFSEIQALSRKDADTLATAIIQAVSPIISLAIAASEQGRRKQRIIHCLTGDGVNTNEAASKRTFSHYTANLPAQVSYYLLVWRCATHQANLATVIGICGKQELEF